MSLKVGSSGEVVDRWIRVMKARFVSYAGKLAVDGYFGLDDAEVQREYERRTHQTPDGIVTDGDLAYLLPAKPWLFTVHGTGMADPLGPGLPADVARDVLDIYRWQPIGNYPAAAFPMKPSYDKAIAELVLQIDQKLAGNNDEFSMAGYSQGAIAVSYVLKHELINPKGRLHKYVHRLKKVVLWGNPMRQKGFAHSDEWIHPVAAPDTMGIPEDRLEALEQAMKVYGFEVRDYAHDGDMYASIKEDDMHEYEVAIGRIVMEAKGFYGGKDSVVAQLGELAGRPLFEMIAMARAIIDALSFLSKSTQGEKWPHLYNRYPAVAFLRQP
ncbi:lysin B [Mycobacterium phage ArcherNM]|uniref:lysin B n=1 Tax=Mycobacterium phage ArcherNM TaxID=1815972 RepID=UPI00078CB9D4|nr:lysin B [Mycobacterium phage ArcherNM]AMS01007.1 lysin B [Mycobacterium phage ArcherNM]